MPIRPHPSSAPPTPRTQADELRLLARLAYEQGRRQEAAELYRKADLLETVERGRS